MKTKSALSYFGSDSEVAADLASLLDGCKHVTIPFCGGLSILPYLQARGIVANDLHDAAINFYHVISECHGVDVKDAAIARCQNTLSHPSDLKHAQHVLKNVEACGAEEYHRAAYAWAFWALCWIGRKGKGGTKHQGGMPSVRRTAAGGTNASRIRAAANDLEEWAKQFERCEFECLDFRELLPKVADRADCGIYCDPPWVGSGRSYLHSFAEPDHRDLARDLYRFEYTRIVVRYDDTPLVRELYEDWHIIEAASRDQRNAVKDELWILNYTP